MELGKAHVDDLSIATPRARASDARTESGFLGRGIQIQRGRTVGPRAGHAEQQGARVSRRRPRREQALRIEWGAEGSTYHGWMQVSPEAEGARRHCSSRPRTATLPTAR